MDQSSEEEEGRKDNRGETRWVRRLSMLLQTISKHQTRQNKAEGRFWSYMDYRIGFENNNTSSSCIEFHTISIRESCLLLVSAHRKKRPTDYWVFGLGIAGGSLKGQLP